jgi:hypothetical protein
LLSWTFRDASGAVTGSSPDFADQDAAESWLSASWPELLERGIDEVALVERGSDHELYRMSLRPG